MSNELAQRAIACKGWRWLPGMLTTDGARLLFEDRVLGWQAWSLTHRRHTLDCTSRLPDLTDPATLGCVLALVREAGGHDGLYCAKEPRAYAKPWRCWHPDNGPVGYGTTEAAALVAALEAAP